MKKFSIIIPSFNQGKFIERCIRSILSEKKNVEIIIIDGESSDNTVDIIQAYSKEIAYWESVPDKGQSHAINKGLEKCTGEIINWIACDDFLEKGSLRKIEKAFENDIDVYCGLARIIENDIVTCHKISSKYTYSWSFTLAFGQNMQPATFWKQQVFLEMAPVREDLHYIMDGYMWLKYILKYGYSRICFDNKNIVVNVDMQIDAKSVKHIDKFYNEWLTIFSWIKDSCDNANKASKNSACFEINQHLVCNEINKINFYLLVDRMFKTGLSKKKRLRFDVLVEIIKKNPLWLIKYYLFEKSNMKKLRGIPSNIDSKGF
ncbi:glycosyltransferase [Candidatus Woesearchaeota archaeon]|nr:glycosyltransferase [Candidatus Woesearchaeota archaeon]MBT4764662.1 glycosyltransferase [bacterium]MBT6671661.1 glycosyltransferase [Lentimicrobiaceae bacterium]MBT7556707.1 glycosyltransferase [Candidatus Woesearchaeota archaeon]